MDLSSRRSFVITDQKNHRFFGFTAIFCYLCRQETGTAIIVDIEAVFCFYFFPFAFSLLLHGRGGADEGGVGEGPGDEPQLRGVHLGLRHARGGALL